MRLGFLTLPLQKGIRTFGRCVFGVSSCLQVSLYFVIAYYGDWLTLDDPAIHFLSKYHLGMANSSVALC